MARQRKAVDKAERMLAGLSPTRLEQKTVEDHAQRWRATFAARTQEATGSPTHEGFDWHSFSYDFVFALSGEAARDEYRDKQRAQSFVVLVGPTMSDGFSCEAETLPWFDGEGLDVYVVSGAFTWTMVFTHEADWCGPYFTTAEWAAKRAPKGSAR